MISVIDPDALYRVADHNRGQEPLNAISRARLLALLLMDLYRERGAEFLPLSAFQHERDFFAQVADGAVWRVPRGMGSELVDALGLSDTDQLRQYRALLRVDKDLWDHADTHSLTERKIRRCGHNQKTTPTGAESAPSDLVKDFEGVLEQLSHMPPESVADLSPEQRTQLRDLLAAHEAWLAEIKQQLN